MHLAAPSDYSFGLRAVIMKPVWATILWSGRTEGPSTFQVRTSASNVLTSTNPAPVAASTVCCT